MIKFHERYSMKYMNWVVEQEFKYCSVIVLICDSQQEAEDLAEMANNDGDNLR